MANSHAVRMGGIHNGTTGNDKGGVGHVDNDDDDDDGDDDRSKSMDSRDKDNTESAPPYANENTVNHCGNGNEERSGDGASVAAADAEKAQLAAVSDADDAHFLAGMLWWALALSAVATPVHDPYTRMQPTACYARG